MLGIITVVIAGVLGSYVSIIMICVAELIAFLVVLLVLMRLKRRPLLAGFLTGVAVVFLLCAACFGLVAGMMNGWGRR